MKNNTQKSPKYFRHLESGEIYFEGLDQKRKLNLINQKTSSEYYLPGQYGEHDYFPFEEIQQPPAPIKEDAKHTPGELPEKLKTVTFGKGSLSVFGIHERKNNRSIYSVEHFDKDQRIFNETVSSAIVTRYNEYPTLLKENEQLKRDVKMLREAAKNFMYNWEALGNANDYSHTATRIAEALSQTETN